MNESVDPQHGVLSEVKAVMIKRKMGCVHAKKEE